MFFIKKGLFLKIAQCFLLGLVFIFFSSSSLFAASLSTLETLRPPEAIQYQSLEKTCQNYESFKDSLISQYKNSVLILESNIIAAAKIHEQWFSVLVQYTDKDIQFEADFFSPVESSIFELDKMSSQIKEWSEFVLADLEEALDFYSGCENVAAENLVRLEAFYDNHYEAFFSLSEYLNKSFDDIKKSSSRWSDWTKASFYFPLSEIEGLEIHSQGLNESGQLIKETAFLNTEILESILFFSLRRF